MSDSTKVFDQLIASHAYTEVENSDFSNFLVGGDLNFKVEVSIEDVGILLRNLVVSEFLGRIGCI